MLSWLWTSRTAVTADASDNSTSAARTSGQRTYAWKRDEPDVRDRWYLNELGDCEYVRRVDLRSRCPPVVDQGALGSCTANAICGAFEYDMMWQDVPDAQAMSRLFVYYNERNAEGHVRTDDGAEIRDGIKSIARQGVCTEALWPYDIARFAERPSDECYEQALHHRAIEYRRVEQTLNDLRAVLLEGFPVVFGFSVFPSFESTNVAHTGRMPMPGPDEKPVGGHAVMIVGYDNDEGVFIVQNSWGTAWGDNGFFYMPFEFATNAALCSDFWVVRLVLDE